MNQQKRVDIPGIGSVLLWRNPRAKRLIIRVKPYDGVRITVPDGMSFRSATDFVEKKKEWILQHLRKLQDSEQQNALFYDGTTGLRTRFHRLAARASNAHGFHVLFAQQEVSAFYPAHLGLDHPDVQAFLKSAFIETLRREARCYLPNRLSELARQHGFQYRRVFIKNQRTRWGSCSERNNINLNLQLMRLPDDLIDHVLLHELVHTEIKNHSPAFWNRLNEVCGGELRRYRRALRAYKLL